MNLSQRFLATLQIHPAWVIMSARKKANLSANEFPLRVSLLVQPVGVDQSRHIVFWVVEDSVNECD
jgi:hypothetical protein